MKSVSNDEVRTGSGSDRVDRLFESADSSAHSKKILRDAKADRRGSEQHRRVIHAGFSICVNQLIRG